MHVHLYKSIAEISQKDWDSIVEKNRIICSYNYLLAVEKSNINDCDYFYPVVYESGQIVAHTCIYSMSFALDLFAQGWVKRLIQWIRKIWPSFLILRFIECGTPVALGNVITISQKVEREKALKLIVEAMQEAGQRKKIGLFLIRDFYEEELFFYKDLESLGFTKVPNLSDTKMDVSWNTFEAYLGTLKYRYKNEIKRNISKISKNGVQTSVEKNFSHLAAQLTDLWKKVYDHAKEYRREILNPEFFMNMDQYLKEATEVTLIQKDGKIIAFVLILIDDECIRPMFLGMDYDYLKDCALYHNNLYSIVDSAIRHEKQSIVLGITSIFPKTDLGAQVVLLFMYMKHRNKLLNLFYPWLFKMMTPVEKPKPKHVFKNDYDRVSLNA
jgi:predicted N-acyltransferase